MPPCPPLREIRTTLDDFCNTKYDARAHREPLDPCYRECPRAPPSTLVTVRRRAPRAGRRVREIAPSAPSGSGSVERGRHRRSGSVTSSTNPVHLLSRCPCWPRGRRLLVLPGSAEVRLRRPLEKESNSTRTEVHSAVRTRLRTPGLLPFVRSVWPPPSGLPTPPERGQQGREDRCFFYPGLAFTLDGWRRWSGLVSSALG